jgi:peptidoglycan/LPS O-acetylase OafA/YrhL
MTPGTSCLATISLSLRDKSRSPIEDSHEVSLAVPVVTATLLAYLSFRFLEKPGIQIGRFLLAQITSSFQRRRRAFRLSALIDEERTLKGLS